jgi:SAM-dependent methyltransferase
MPHRPQPEPIPAGVIADLEQWARLSGWTRHHIRAVEQFWRRLGEPRPFRVVDFGCGLGGLLDEIAAWASRTEVTVELCGLEPDPEIAAAARERLGDRAMIRVSSFYQTGLPPAACHLATCTLLLNRLSGPERLRLAAEIGRVASTAYVFDVTPTIAGEVGARLIPWLAGLNHAPPREWLETLERAPTPDELAKLLRHLPVQVQRVFPSAICSAPEPSERASVPVREPTAVAYALPDLPSGLVGADRAPAGPIGAEGPKRKRR